MLEFLTNTFNTSVMVVTQLVLSTVVSDNPWFENVEMELSQSRNALVCSASLMDTFTESLDVVLQSGQTITLHFSYDLMEAENKILVNQGEVVHGLRYRLLDDRYYLLRSEEGELEELFDFQTAKRSYVSIDKIEIAEAGQLDRQKSYILQLRAFLDPVEMPSMAETVNLMLLWASIKPTYISEPFTLRASG